MCRGTEQYRHKILKDHRIQLKNLGDFSENPESFLPVKFIDIIKISTVRIRDNKKYVYLLKYV